MKVDGLINSTIEFKAPDEVGVFEGFGAKFGNIDFDGDIIERGAFANSIKAISETGRALPLLWQHDPREPIGKFTLLQETKDGLFVRGKLTMGVDRAREAHALMSDNALSGMSIGFQTKKSELDKSTGVRTLKELDLREVSLVTFPANDDARVTAVKMSNSLDTERDFERMLMRDAGLSRSEARIIINSGFKSLLAKRDAGNGLDELEAADVALAQLRALKESVHG